MMEYLLTDTRMSLYGFISNGFQLHSVYYNCDGINATVLGEKRPLLGSYFLAAGIVFISLYVPCLVYIARSELLKSSCYKIMLYLGIVDIGCITINSLTTGTLGIMGASFCTAPRFIFVAGSVAVGCWMGSCITCILLAINRCCDVNNSLRIRTIFTGRKIYATLSFLIFYTLYPLFFTKPVIFSSIYMSWFFNPQVGANPDAYVNMIHSINNCIVSFATTSLYTYLCILLAVQNRHAQSDSLSKTQKQIFAQSVLVCSFNAIAAYIYVYMQFFYSPPAVILIGQIAWQYSNGAACIIYVTLNKTIRRGVIDMMVPMRIRSRLRIGTRRVLPRAGFISVDVKQTAQTSTSNGAIF